MESVTILSSFIKNYFMSLRTMRLCIAPLHFTSKSNTRTLSIEAIDITTLTSKGLY